MSKYRSDALSLFYFKDRHEADSVFNDLVAVDDAICKAKNFKTGRKRLEALLDTPLHEQSKEFVRRLLRDHEARLKRITQTAIRRVFTSTHHYDSGLTHRTIKARLKNKQKENSTP